MGYGAGIFSSSTRSGRAYNYFSTNSNNHNEYNSSEDERLNEEDSSVLNSQKEVEPGNNSGDGIIRAMWIIAIIVVIISLMYVVITDGFDSLWGDFWGFVGIK